MFLEKLAGALVNFDQPHAHAGLALLLGRGVAHLRQRNLEFLGDQANCFRKADVLNLLHETEDVARCSATEAVKELSRGVHRKRRRFFLVKGAQALEVLRSAFAQGHVLAHNADDVGLLLDDIRKIPGVGHVW